MKKYELFFDKVMIKQLKKLKKEKSLRRILSKMFDVLENRGNECGKIIDTRLHLYELKNKSPAVRLYFKLLPEENEIYVFEYDIKKNKKDQILLIDKLRTKIQDLFLYIFFLKYYFRIQGVFYTI